MPVTPPTVQPPTLRTKFVDATGGLMPTSLQFLQQMWLAIKTAFETFAPIESPTFTGVPAAPTAAPGTNTTQIATTAFVAAAGAGLASAPDSADYLVKTAHGSLSAERVVTDTVSVTWDWATAGQAKASVGTGYVGGSAIATVGTITSGVWTGTAVAVANGGTGSTTASGARTNLGAAVDSADYLVKTADGGLSAERVVTDTATITWNWATGGQAKANLTQIPVTLTIACSDETTALTTGAGKVTFRMPHAMTVTEVRASLTTAQATGSTFAVDVNEAGTTIFSTALTIDNTAKTSVGAGTPAVISDASLADDAEIRIDIDTIGDGTAKGLKVSLIGTRAV